MSDTWDDEDRAIARALGADDPSPDATADADAVADYEAVLSHLPFDEVEPPLDLEDRVVAAALARRPAAATAITGRRSISRRGIAAGAMMAAAAAIIVVLAVSVAKSGSNPTRGRIEPASACAVAAGPDTRIGELRSRTDPTFGRIALDAHGRGCMDRLALAGRAPARWLWLENGSQTVRVGPLPHTSHVRFVVDGPVDGITGAFVTSEKPGATPATPGPQIARASFS